MIIYKRFKNIEYPRYIYTKNQIIKRERSPRHYRIDFINKSTKHFLTLQENFQLYTSYFRYKHFDSLSHSFIPKSKLSNVAGLLDTIVLILRINIEKEIIKVSTKNIRIRSNIKTGIWNLYIRCGKYPYQILDRTTQIWIVIFLLGWKISRPEKSVGRERSS